MTIIDKACWERGCACYDSRVDSDGVEVVAALEAKDEKANDELRRLHDLLGKANALARIRANKIDELEQRLTKTEAQLGEAVWNYGELKREQLANQQKTSGSPINTSTALEAKDEPWEKFCDSNCVWTDHHPDCKLAQRKPLTDEQLESIWEAHQFSGRPSEVSFANRMILMRAIEAAHNITGEA